MTTEDTNTEAAVIPKGYWPDANGNLIPVSKIKDIDKHRHQVVTELAERAKAVQQILAKYKESTFLEIEAFLQKSAADYGVQMRGAAGKGNVQLVSFDGKYKILRAVQDTISFDERLQVAKSIIDECVHLWAKGSNANIKVLVNHAFQVDSAGQVSISRILSLRQIKINDPQWAEAMKAIGDSMKTVSSKSYVRIYERNAQGKYDAIPLDLAAI